MELSWLRIEPCPLPFCVWAKIAGALGVTFTANEADAVPLFITTAKTLESVETSYGTIALIWFADTKISGAAMPLKVTDVSPSVVATKPDDVSFKPIGVAGPMFEPKIDTSSPGDTPPSRKSAAFRIDMIVGGPADV